MARYALVIGISEYNEPFDFLEKAAQDADDVGQKLKEDGGYKVTSLTSNVNGKKLHDELEKFLLEEAKQGDALIYFTGHGFQVVEPYTEEKSSFLAGSDCIVKSGDSQIISQENGIPFKALNKLIEQSSLSSLVVLLDACHGGGFIENSFINSNLVDQSLPIFKSGNRNYCFIASCRSHQTAEAYQRDNHSVFTKALIEGLSQNNSDPKTGQITATRLFDDIYRELEASKQEPIYEGKGRPIAVIEYKPISPQSPSDAIRPGEIESLLGILQLQDISKMIQQAYAECLPNPWLGSIASDISSMLKQLNEEFPRKAEKLPIFEFVNRLSGNSSIPELLRSKLQNWVSNTSQTYGIRLTGFDLVTAPKANPYVLIRLKPSKQQENRFYIKAWFFLDDKSKAEYSQFKPLSSQRFPEEQPHSFEDISELLNDFLDQTFGELENTKNATQPIIEFFLPRDYLCADVDQLSVLDAIGEEIQLGTDYQVVVRSYERLNRRYRQKTRILWLDKWNQAKELNPPFAENLFERLNQSDGHDWDSLRANLANKIGLQLIYPPGQFQSADVKPATNKRDWVAALLSTATPIAIWPRCSVSETTFISAIDELFNAGALSALPEYVRKKRLEAMQQSTEDHIGHHLVLLWEDPDRLPPDEEEFEHKIA